MKTVKYTESMVLCAKEDKYLFGPYDIREYLGLTGGSDWPESIDVCEPYPLVLDVMDVLENALQDHYEDAADRISNADYKELQKSLDVFCKKVDIVSWEPDGETQVLVSDIVKTLKIKTD